jgi:hypothetical protein
MSAFVLSISQSIACDSNNHFSSFAEYKESMAKHNSPLTLMVGCGHGTSYHEGEHTHPDCWSVNLSIDPSLRGFPHNTKENFKKDVQYDEILDITTVHFPPRGKNAREILIRDTASSNPYVQTIIGYKNTFDIVVLERPLPETLNKAWTLWNAVHMLKVGGELIIDSIDGYDSKFYDKNGLFGQLCPQEDQAYPVNQNLNKLEQFGIARDESLPVNQDMVRISNYLAFWGLTDIINVGDRFDTRRRAYQPYTKKPGESLETARKSNILSATKTQETEDKMEKWARELQDRRILLL